MKLIVATFLLVSSSLLSQDFNKEIIPENGKKYMLGKINKEGLTSEPYNAWFTKGHDVYAVDKSMVKLFKKKLVKHHVKLFLGTWCGDSKREVPRFIKILETAKFPMEQLEIVALDRRKEFYKSSPTGEEKGLNIVKVPTFIFVKNGEEVNRIIERPIESLEEDIETIVNGKKYTPNYTDVKRTW